MATNQVNQPTTVSVNVQTLSRQEIEARAKEAREKQATSVFDPGDNVAVQPSQNATVAESGEGKAPKGKSGHEKFKTARHGLEKALKEAGFDVKPNDSLAKKAQAALDVLDGKMTKGLEKGGLDMAEIERQRNQLIGALRAFENAEAEAAAETVGTQSVQGTNESAGADGAAANPNPEEVAALWNDIDAELKTLGIPIDKTETDVVLIRNKATAQFTKEFAKVKEQESSLSEQRTGLLEKLKTAATPKEKEQIQTQLKAVEVELKNVLLQKQSLQIAYHKVNEAFMNFEAVRDLGMKYDKNKRVETPTTAKTSSAKKETPAPSGPVTTRSAKTASAPGAGAGGGVTLNTASAGGSSYTQGTQGAGFGGGQTEVAPSGPGGAGTGGGLVETASAEDAGAPVTGSSNILNTSAANDFSGTTLAIASTSNALRSDARRTDEAIKKLLRAAASGNYEAIKTALIMLDKRASQIVIGMGSATIKAMQYYEKQMGALSKSLDALKTTDASYNAKLAQVNSQMNIYSMNRQAIANFLQQTLTAREEIGNTTKGFISKDGQIGSALSRW